MQGKFIHTFKVAYSRIGQQSMLKYFSRKEENKSQAPLKRKREETPENQENLQPEESKIEISPPPTQEFPQYAFQDYELNENPHSLSSDKYDPILDAKFKYLQPPPFRILVDAYELVANSKGKSSKTIQKDVIANLFRSIIVLRPDHLVKCFYLCVGKFCPDHQGIELGVGNEALYKAVARTTGLSIKQIKQQENTTGDLGSVAATGKATQKNLTSYFSKKTKTIPHTISDVYEGFWKICNLKGQNSTALKEDELVRLLNQADSDEAKYIIRIVQKSLKIGASELTMQSALARAIAMTPPKQAGFPPAIIKAKNAESIEEEVENILKKSINECPDYDKIINAVLQYGPDGEDLSIITKLCNITPGTPVKPMLAQPTKGIQEILKRFTGIEFTCEYKYDGMRAQIHILADRTIHIYSRNSENITEMYPDVIQFLSSHIDFNVVRDCIMDSEVVAFDAATNRIKPFQDIQHRGRKNVDINQIEVKVCIFPFDMLYLNGASLIDIPLSQRREYLKSSIKEEPGLLQFVTHKNVSVFEDIETLLWDSVKIGCEGLMVKTLHENATYEPAKRSLNWLKLKKDYITDAGSDSKMADSVDLVPIGAFYGTGKRAGVYGSYLLAVYDSLNDEYQTVCKTSTGFSDELLQTLTNSLKDFEVPRMPKNYRSFHTNIDVWFKPEMVWEIKGADISISPIHTSAWCKAAPDKGLSIRFPRFIRLRPDKKPEQSTAPEQILQMYYQQSSVEGNNDELI
ncbi:unnamed protein product [Blepharisma stoltei]|uniref:DNA ligase n=1 Tax=Blepharisma stoltei TaxID=1481888 RepID=A0AAU9JMP8_9CILI|nr:unnamed protein product [Blepharisma stoltei]